MAIKQRRVPGPSSAHLGSNQEPVDDGLTSEERTALDNAPDDGTDGQRRGPDNGPNVVDGEEEDDDPDGTRYRFVDREGRRIGQSTFDAVDDVVTAPGRLADPDTEAAAKADPTKVKLGVRLDQYTADEAARVDARAIRIHDYNALAKAEGRPQAVTKEEQDRIP